MSFQNENRDTDSKSTIFLGRTVHRGLEVKFVFDYTVISLYILCLSVCLVLGTSVFAQGGGCHSKSN